MTLAGDPTIRWHVAHEIRDALFIPDGRLPIETFIRDGSARVIKSGPHRTVYRVTRDGVDVFLKEYRAAGLRNRLRELIRPVKGRRESDRARALAGRQIPVPEPLGWGVLGSRFAPRASFVISRAVESAVHLADAPRQATPVQRHALAKELGRFLACLHAAGVTHRDLHPGNVLVRWETGRPKMILLDLHEVSLGKPLDWPRRRDNLATINRYYMLRATRAERLRFWRSYAAAAGDAIPNRPDATPAGLEAATLESNRVLWRSRARKYSGDSRLVCRERRGSMGGLFVRDLDPAAAASLLSQPDAALTSFAARSLKIGGRSTVAATPLGVIKRFNIRSAADLLKNLVRPTPQWHAWVMGHALLDAGLPTPRPLATVTRYRYRFVPAEGYLLAEELPNLLDLREFVDRVSGLPPRERHRALRDRAVCVAMAVRAFHDRGFGHRDLKAGNLLTPANVADHRVWFVDLAGVTCRRRNPRSSRNRDLARLFASFLEHPTITPGVRLRFLLAYRGPGTAAKAGWQRNWREIGQRGNSVVADIRARGRPVG
jgi:tRNA A-37 threonylcarbamoyl transferase component Bud32